MQECMMGYAGERRIVHEKFAKYQVFQQQMIGIRGGLYEHNPKSSNSCSRTGTRYLPVTKSMPKEMLPIIDKPVIHYVVEEAIDAGIEDIIIITGRGKRAIEDYFDTSPELEMRLKDREQK